MSGGLSTHVLDLARGRPAAGLRIELYKGDERLFDGSTNDDGRCPGLLSPGALVAAGYRFVFHAGDYLRGQAPGGAAPFFDRVSVEFTVSDPDSHHHVPLLLSPYGYSTYRGS